ncbi:adenylate cyclase type 10-like isoform X3 [Zophobas morio]|uniref:adenylate cyclase type 10-like isoform X3 n=1 Tax=Zophobas morio TaxID=2755281 RepID=UPI003082AE65
MRWEYLIGGQPMLEIAHAEAAAKSGDVVLTGRTWGLVSEHCKGRMINGEPALWLLEEISIKFKPPANPPVDPDLSIQASLRSYIPETIRKRIDIGLSDWMAELRRVTVMFVQLTNLTFTGRDEETDKLQHSFTHMQSAIYDYSGIIRQFIIDDKGSVLVAAFFQHEDDPVRALKAGINIISRLKNINVNSSIGVTTGKVFLGAVGSSIRHEFAMVGDTVNLAARLMAANAYPGTLLKFLSLNSIRVKGKSTLIPIFKASLEASGDVLVCPSLGDNREEAAIVGREEECDLLLKFIEDGLSGKKIVFVEGEEGIGKSLFLSHVRERIANQGCTIANIKGDSANSMTPLHAWRRFTLERIFKFAKPVAENSTEELRAAVLESLSKINSVDAAPLLNDSFMLSFPDTRPGLEPNAKLAETVSLFTKLIAKEVSDAQKFVVFIDDGDLVDRWSYEVLTLLSKVFISLVIIISRGLTSTIPSETKSLIETSEVFHLRLSPLTSESTREIILQVLQAKSIPNAVVALIHERSSGNPYFTVLLATSLLESNAVKVLPHGECEFSKKLKNVEDIALPDTLENLITSRIGRLSSKDQFVLKVASVVGMQFEFRLLTMIYPVPEDKGSLAQSIEALQAMNFIEPIPYEKEPTFQFTQTAVRDCCYNLLLFEQRRLLHVSVAEWYKEFNDDSKPYDHLLGYHYECAGDLSNSSLHYKLAADEALAQYSLKKAANFYITAFKNFKNVQSANQSGFYAQLLNGLAECFYRLGQYKKAYFYFESALKYLGQPLPRMKTGSSIKDVFRWKSSTKGDDALCLEAVRCYENLSVIFYAVGDKSKMVNCVHQALSLSTVLDSKAELARIHVLLSLSSKVSGDETTADKQLKRAQELVSCVPHALTFANVLFYATLKDALNGIPSPTDFKSVLEMYSRAFEWTKWCEATQLLSMCSLWAGDFGESLEAGKRLLECGVKYDDVVTSITGHLVQARAHLGRTEYSAALQWLMEASRIFESEENLTFHTSLHLETMGLLACAYFRSSDFARTVEVVHDILHMELLEVHFHLYLMYCELIVICLALWLAPQCEALTSKCSVDIKGLLLRLYNALSHMAKAFPVCAPRALMRKGQVDWVLGNAKKAKRNLEEALSLAAEKLPSGMKYEMAFCQFEVGFLLEDELVREAVFKKGAEQLAELKVPFPPSLISN